MAARIAWAAANAAAGHPLASMAAYYIILLAAYHIIRKIWEKRRDRILARKNVQDLLREIAYLASKPQPAQLRINHEDRASARRHRKNKDLSGAGLDAMRSALDAALFNEACRAWFESAVPDLKARCRSMPGPGRQTCRGKISQARYEMPDKVEIQISYTKKAGSLKYLKPFQASTDDLARSLDRTEKRRNATLKTRLAREQRFRCACCGTKLDECLVLDVYQKKGGDFEARCPKCLIA